MRRAALLLLMTGCGGAAPAPAPADDAELAAVTVPALPDWTNKYAGQDRGDPRFFRIEALMARHGLDRLGAVEVQNRHRDLTRADEQADRGEVYRRAVADVKGGWRESGLTPDELKAEFIVAFDLDDTLYDQYRASEGCHDLAFTGLDGKPKYIKLTPGWEEAIRRVNQLGGVVVLFSANRDETNYANFQHWKLDDQPLHESPLVGGVLTNSFLVVQEKSAGDVVVVPSKDLRFFDEDLERVVIVDDNPLRLFQMRNTRIFKKFRADDYCATDDPARKKAYEQALPTVVREIEASVAWARANGVPFARAYLPHTAIGRHAVDALKAANGWSEEEAVDHVRRHPDVVDPAY